MQTTLSPSRLPLPVLLIPSLREGTRDLHERIESRMDLAVRLASPGAYRALLERYYGYYMPLEERLAAPEHTAASADLGVDFEGRRKAGLLEADLRVLGLTTTDLTALTQCPVGLLPTLSTTAELVGCAYVLEGATLGGQIIGRHLEQAQGLRPGGPGARFFHGYGPRTGALWQQFRRAAEEFLEREEWAGPGSGTRVVQQAVAAARLTFSGIEAWLIPEEGGSPVSKS